MIGSVGGNPFATQTQAYSALKPGVTEQENPNDKLKPASEDKDSSTVEKTAASSDLKTSGVSETDSAERSYDSGGISARGNEQRGMLLDVSA